MAFIMDKEKERKIIKGPFYIKKDVISEDNELLSNKSNNAV